MGVLEKIISGGPYEGHPYICVSKDDFGEGRGCLGFSKMIENPDGWNGLRNEIIIILSCVPLYI